MVIGKRDLPTSVQITTVMPRHAMRRTTSQAMVAFDLEPLLLRLTSLVGLPQGCADVAKIA
jgi:hypothetical protein